MTIKNHKHYSEEQIELIQDLFHELEKFAEESKTVYMEPEISLEEKVNTLKYIESKSATVSNLINNVFEYEIRDDDRCLLTQKLFNRCFGYRNCAEIDLMKKIKKEVI